ncbi:sigma-54 interaction domain-containing protein [Nevskia soli]|jgi:transcriptional regulator with PAS, ATPase and Fis domain|uniref:sigma-54 interaction domain-containing protein n=1 Tax=Nevskia soli TaxID=418856 RepID=UPI0015D85D50|nr:sigma-54 dependent transcriptional regulator [Nevskia soli]
MAGDLYCQFTSAKTNVRRPVSITQWIYKRALVEYSSIASTSFRHAQPSLCVYRRDRWNSVGGLTGLELEADSADHADVNSSPESFLGKTTIVASPQMMGLLGQVRRVAQAKASVLIEGESGSGKEIIARALHHYSSRRTKPWVDVSCAALPEHLVESELLGYERGAFSGALNSKPGLFELAHEGTLLLDEIGEFPLNLQAKLLRVLDGSTYFRLGGTRKLSVDVRIVAATNRSLKSLVQQKLFREDLYYRLSQVCLRVPPLRERPDDIKPLAEHFLAEIRPGMSISGEAIRRLERHLWPGNIRELRNVITSASLAAEEFRIEANHIDLDLEEMAQTPVETSIRTHAAGTLGTMEREAVLATLRRTQGDRQQTAEALGISLRTLNRRLSEYGQVRSRRVSA